MITHNPLQEKISQFASVLDNDIFSIELSLSRLEQLRLHVVRRDERSLENILGRIHAEQNKQMANEYQRQKLRKEFAGLFGVDYQQVCLSLILGAASDKQRQALEGKKGQLEKLTKKLSRELRSVSMLVSEFARFNSAVLNSLIKLGRSGEQAYQSDGKAGPTKQSVFMNYRL